MLMFGHLNVDYQFRHLNVDYQFRHLNVDYQFGHRVVRVLNHLNVVNRLGTLGRCLEMGASGGTRQFFQSTYLTEGRTTLHQEAIGPKGSNFFFEGIRTNISKETYSHLSLSNRGGGLDPLPPSGSANVGII